MVEEVVELLPRQSESEELIEESKGRRYDTPGSHAAYLERN